MPRPPRIRTLVTVGGGGGPNPVDTLNPIKLKVTETNPVPTDAFTAAISIAGAETNPTPTEATRLTILTTESTATPTESALFTARVWLSATTMESTNGVTNPANANGANDAAVATYQSVALGDTQPRTRSTLGANIPAGVSLTSAIIRCWFQSTNTLVTSSGTILLTSIGAVFPDVIIFQNAALTTTVDHLAGTFTYDLIAGGINTAAEIASIQFIVFTFDTVAGVTPHNLTLDSACVELAGAFS